MQLLKVFINSSFGLEVELTFFDLTNYKLLLYCALSLKICAKCQQPPAISTVLSLALELRKGKQRKKKGTHYSISFTETFHLAAAFSTLWK